MNIDSAPDSDPRALNIVFVLQRTQLPRPEPGQDRKAISVDIEVLCRFPAPQRCAAGEERFQAVRRHNSFLGLFGAGGDSEIFRVQTGLAPLPAPFQPIQETAPDIPQRLIGEVVLGICQVNHGLQVAFSKLVMRNTPMTGWM